MAASKDGIRDRIYRKADRWEDENLNSVDRRLREMVDRGRMQSGIMGLHLRMHPETWDALDRWVNSAGMWGVIPRCNPDHERESIALIDQESENDQTCPPKANG